MNEQGQIFGDNYAAEEILGEGSFGVVYLCQDRRLQRKVAVKVLKPELADARELNRFLAEARRMAALSHENVVQVFYLDEKVPFIAMEYFPGRTLREMAKPLSLDRAVGIMTQVASGLKALHDMQVVHRDLSSNNIMVGNGDKVKILDLGLARDVEKMSATATQGNLAGTLKYMAPEVIDGHPATAASDVFSFGVLLYELTTGQHPFEAEHFMSMFYNIVNKPHPPLSEVMPGIPGTLDEVMDLCLVKNPRERLSDLGLVEDRFRALLASPGLRSADPTPVVQPIPPRRSGRFRNPYLNRVMIKRAADFFGRAHEVRRIYSRLNATPPGSVSVVGDRKIGKSSLLNYVYMRRNREKHLEDNEHTIMVFIDLQQQKDMSLDHFVDTVLGIANLELRGRMDVSDCSRDLNGVKQFVERLHDGGYRLVLLMDEFEAITTNANFDLEFFSFLRYLANHYNVAYLTSSARDLQQLCHTKEIRDSPFFNIFTPLALTVFRLEEARELIRDPSAQAGRPLEPYEAKILAMAGLFPFFLQVACSHALEFLEENPNREIDFGEVKRRFYEEARLHYRFMWDAFDPHERSAILKLACGKKIPDSLRHVCDELERKSYVEKDDSQMHLFSTAFSDFIQSEISGHQRSPWYKKLFGRS